MKNHAFLIMCVLFSLLVAVFALPRTNGIDSNEPIAKIVQNAKETGNVTGTEKSTALEEGTMSITEKKRVALQREMIAFWETYKENMEIFALQMKTLQIEEPYYTVLYAVNENALYAFDGVHIEAQRKIVDHPLLSETAFFRQTQAFEWAAWNSDWFEHDACIFTGNIYDEEGSLYAELFLFYSEEEPVTDEFSAVKTLETNWYFYYEYRE